LKLPKKAKGDPLMQTETEILENLRDAGCDEKEIDAILSCYKKGDSKNTEKLIEGCRKRQLEKMHDSQLCIDRLDYLKYQIGKAQQ